MKRTVSAPPLTLLLASLLTSVINFRQVDASYFKRARGNLLDTNKTPLSKSARAQRSFSVNVICRSSHSDGSGKEMLKRLVSGIMLALFLLCTLNLTFNQKYGIPKAFSSPLSKIYVDPSSYMFDASTATIGTLFNVTVKVDNVVDMKAWQVKMWFNDTIINVTRWYEPKTDPTYVFYGQTTLPVPAPPKPAYGRGMLNVGGWLGVGASLFPSPDVGGGFSGNGLLCILTFNITALPPPSRTYPCVLNVTNYPDTFYIKAGYSAKTSFDQYENGYYECSACTYLIVRGMDNRIYYRVWNETLWEGWRVLPGSTIDSPATVMIGNELHVVVRGINHNQIWHGYVNLTDRSFSGWTQLSGSTPSAPTLTANDTTLCLTVRGETNIVYYRFYDVASKVWGGWTAVPQGTTYTSPAAAMRGNELHMVVRGINHNQIWHGYVNLTDRSFSGWTQLSGSTPSAPTLTANSTTLCLVVRGETNCTYYRFYNLTSHTWNGWTPFPSYATPDNPASGATIDSPTATILDGTLNVVVRGLHYDQIWHGYVDLTDNTFSGWTQLSGSTPSKPTLTS